MNIGKAEGFLSTKLNNRRLKTRDIQVLPPVVPPRYSSVPLDGEKDDEASDVRFMTPTMTVTHTKKMIVLSLMQTRKKVL